MTKDVIDEDGDWRHRRDKCSECGQISLYRMPIVISAYRCENPDCDVNGIKRELNLNQKRGKQKG